jgi:hypothetical protein
LSGHQSKKKEVVPGSSRQKGVAKGLGKLATGQ